MQVPAYAYTYLKPKPSILNPGTSILLLAAGRAHRGEKKTPLKLTSNQSLHLLFPTLVLVRRCLQVCAYAYTYLFHDLNLTCSPPFLNQILRLKP